MNRNEAYLVKEGMCLIKKSKRFDRFEVMRVTKVNLVWNYWVVDIISFRDGVVSHRDDVMFDFNVTIGYDVVDCEREFVKLHKILKMQDLVINPVIKNIKSAQKINVSEKEPSDVFTLKEVTIFAPKK